VTVVAVADKSAVFAVTTGAIEATCTAAPLDCELDVTTAVKLPTAAGGVE
jgi:hypothetical protein